MNEASSEQNPQIQNPIIEKKTPPNQSLLGRLKRLIRTDRMRGTRSANFSFPENPTQGTPTHRKTASNKQIVRDLEQQASQPHGPRTPKEEAAGIG